MFRLLIAFTLLASASARCANDCSGHGTCGKNDRCTCYANWQGGDCSDRTCPFSRAWADNGERSHVECGNRGTCDRKTGVCECEEAYTGSGCGRHACPNGCSNHGTCQTMKELGLLTNKKAHGQTSALTSKRGINDYPLGGTSSYNLWDAEKSRSCVCDGGYTGHDCSKRMCPKGDDPLTTEVDITQTETTSLQVAEVQSVSVVAATDFLTGTSFKMNGGEVAFTYTDLYGTAWTTRPVTLPLVKTWDTRESGTSETLDSTGAWGLKEYGHTSNAHTSNTRKALLTSGTVDGRKMTYWEVTITAIAGGAGGDLLKKGDWIMLYDEAGQLAECHVQVAETYAISATSLKIQADRIQGACATLLHESAPAMRIYGQWTPFTGSGLFDGSTKKVTSYNSNTGVIQLEEAQTCTTGACHLTNLHLGSWVRVHSKSVANQWCDFQVTGLIDGEHVKVSAASATSTDSNAASGNNVLCESWEASTTKTADGTTLLADFGLAHIRNHATLSATDSTGKWDDDAFVASPLTWRIDTVTNVITRSANFDADDADTAIPGALFHLYTGADSLTVLCSGIVGTGPTNGAATFTAEAPPATIAGVATTSCLTTLTASPSAGAHMVIFSDNAIFYRQADARAPTKFTGVSAGDSMVMSGMSPTTTNTAGGNDMVHLDVARVSSDGSAVHFARGSKPNGGGMYAPIGITVTTLGDADVWPSLHASHDTSVDITSATNYLPNLAAGLGTTVIFQSFDSTTCGWCTTDQTYINHALDVKKALQELPNQVIATTVDVAMNGAGLGRYGYTITFGAGNSGNQNDIVLQGAGCNDDGCQPRYSGVYIQQQQVLSTAVVAETSTGSGIYDVVGEGGTGVWPKANKDGGGFVSTGFCLVDGGEKYVMYGYVATGDNTGKVFTSSSCSDANGITFVEPATAHTGIMTNFLRLRTMGDFEGSHDDVYDMQMPHIGNYFRSVTTEITRGTKESSECSGRGKCDTSSGVCDCHEGYTGEACETQTVLI